MGFNGHHTEETKEKIRAFQKKKVFSLETKQKISLALKGKKLSEEAKKNMSLARIGKPSKMKGIKTNRIPKSAFKKGNIPWSNGKKMSSETLKKMSISALNRYKNKENHPRYKKDRDSLCKNEKKHLDTKYKIWMLNVKKRDNFKCRLSGIKCKGRLEAHHIFNWTEYSELRYVINNGITLCQAHHPKGRAEEKRMIPIFQELLSVSEE